MTNYTGSTPDTAARRLDWMEHAACRDAEPDLFSEKETMFAARLLCVVRCPVRELCLAHVKETERGERRNCRDGLVAGLTHNERWRLDPEAFRGNDDPPLLVLDGTEPCGSYNALLGHMWRGERVDPECWSAEVRRDRLDRVSVLAKRRDHAVETP